MNRLSTTFARLKAENRPGFVAYVMAGDPDAGTTSRLLRDLPAAGADIIELGIPFTDPMADGPAIQAAALRALQAGMTLRGVLDLAREFRARDAATPLVLMGYANPVHAWGFDAFARDAAAAGVDGLICVDIPPEEDGELRAALDANGIALIRLATPTTDDKRLPRVVEHTSGFVYYVSVAGVTGAGAGETGDIAAAVARIRAASGLPVAVGFGVSSPEQAAAIGQAADAVVVGSAIVTANHQGGPGAALDLVRTLSAAAHGA